MPLFATALVGYQRSSLGLRKKEVTVIAQVSYTLYASKPWRNIRASRSAAFRSDSTTSRTSSFEANARLPSKLALRFGCVAQQRLHFGRPEVARVNRDLHIPRLVDGFLLTPEPDNVRSSSSSFVRRYTNSRTLYCCPFAIT
jgi:hypothetical protein